jgi:hypothetical protein
MNTNHIKMSETKIQSRKTMDRWRYMPPHIAPDLSEYLEAVFKELSETTSDLVGSYDSLNGCVHEVGRRHNKNMDAVLTMEANAIMISCIVLGKTHIIEFLIRQVQTGNLDLKCLTDGLCLDNIEVGSIDVKMAHFLIDIEAKEGINLINLDWLIKSDRIWRSRKVHDYIMKQLSKDIDYYKACDELLNSQNKGVSDPLREFLGK